MVFFLLFLRSAIACECAHLTLMILDTKEEKKYWAHETTGFNVPDRPLNTPFEPQKLRIQSTCRFLEFITRQNQIKFCFGILTENFSFRQFIFRKLSESMKFFGVEVIRYAHPFVCSTTGRFNSSLVNWYFHLPFWNWDWGQQTSHIECRTVKLF